jgi:hypothetical protein
VIELPYTERKRRLALATMARTLRSSKVVACWRRAISSNLGCFHDPLGVYDWSACAEGVEGVDGVTGVRGAADWVVRASDMVDEARRNF